VREHMDLVHKLVSQTAKRVPSYVCRDDLVSAGMASLAMAARQFDESRGVPFERYAATRIRGGLIDELRAHDWASRPVRSRARAVASTTEKLTASLGRPPTSTEVADAAGLTVGALAHLTDDVHRAVVLNFDSLVADHSAEALLPTADGDPEEELLRQERAECVTKAIDALPERLRVVVRGYFFEERTVSEIADELGVTQSRISQLRTEAIELLRDGVNAQLDPEAITPLSARSATVSRRRVAYRAAMAG